MWVGRIVAALFCCACSELHADGFELPSESIAGLEIPASLNVAMYREKLNTEFPEMIVDSGVKRRDAIEDYRRGLDRFNRIHLNGFASEIEAICVELKRVEKVANDLGRQGKISASERESYLSQIANERLDCLASNYHTSAYWRLYQDFLNLYRERDKDSKRDLDDCLSQNACRRREI